MDLLGQQTEKIVSILPKESPSLTCGKHSKVSCE